MKPRLVPPVIPQEVPQVVTRREVNGYVIEAGVPIPKPGGGQPPQGMSAIACSLKVGESFIEKEWTEKKRKGLHTYMERTGKKIKTRTEKDGSLRVWRIE